jgi:hypothetical protein
MLSKKQNKKLKPAQSLPKTFKAKPSSAASASSALKPHRASKKKRTLTVCSSKSKAIKKKK